MDWVISASFYCRHIFVFSVGQRGVCDVGVCGVATGNHMRSGCALRLGVEDSKYDCRKSAGTHHRADIRALADQC